MKPILTEQEITAIHDEAIAPARKAYRGAKADAIIIKEYMIALIGGNRKEVKRLNGDYQVALLNEFHRNFPERVSK